MTPTFKHKRRPAPRPQQGIALIVGLVILVILALLGTTAYSVATQEERMAGNARDHARAFEAAEFALRFCEAKVKMNNPVFQPVATAPAGAGFLAAPTNGQWTGDGPIAAWSQYAVAPTNFTGDAAQPPICIAEDFQKGVKLDPSSPLKLIPHTARVTAVGYGITSGANVTLVSYYNYFTTH